MIIGPDTKEHTQPSRGWSPELYVSRLRVPERPLTAYFDSSNNIAKPIHYLQASAQFSRRKVEGTGIGIASE